MNVFGNFVKYQMDLPGWAYFWIICSVPLNRYFSNEEVQIAKKEKKIKHVNVQYP
jgi:hypothetical protein